MSAWRVMLAVVVLAAAPLQPEPKYFHFYAEVSVPQFTQAYVNITPEVWQNATSDLRDLRLYDGGTQVPYALAPASSEEVRGTEKDATILNMGQANGATQFVVDTHEGDSRSAYESIQLSVRDDAPDFVAAAQAEGFNRFEDMPVTLGKSTLFKLEREKLGANLSVKFRPVIFRYVRITVPSIEPKAIVGARIFLPGTSFGWTDIPIRPSERVEGHDSVFEWDAADTVPVGRISFQTEGAKEFWRRVDVEGEHQSALATGAIWSIRSHGAVDPSTNLDLLIPGEARSKHFKLIVHNGDDPPLKLSVRAAYRQRRLYFTPPNGGALRLYFGDGDLQRPTYDYAQIHGNSLKTSISGPFESSYGAATLGAVVRNSEYTPRPDQRPWTEQHPAVLWIALSLAVVGLGAVALKSLKPGAQHPGDGG